MQKGGEREAKERHSSLLLTVCRLASVSQREVVVQRDDTDALRPAMIPANPCESVATSIPQAKPAFNPPTPSAIGVFRGGQIERSSARDLVRWNGGLVQNKALASRKKK